MARQIVCDTGSINLFILACNSSQSHSLCHIFVIFFCIYICVCVYTSAHVFVGMYVGMAGSQYDARASIASLEPALCRSVIL